jgi:integrase
MTLTLTRLDRTLPDPTKANPHVQLDWLCDRYVRRYKNEETKKGMRNSIQAYKHFLQSSGGYDQRLVEDPRFYLATHCDSFVLYKAEEFWRAQAHSSYTIATRLSDLRKLFNFAAEKKLTPTSVFFFPRLERTKRETLQREAYEAKELDLIWRIFAQVFNYARRIASGYKPSWIDNGPSREIHSEPPRAGTSQGITIKWSWENFVRYFEKEMNCQPVIADEQGYTKHAKFFAAATEHYGSVKEVWRCLGVAPLIGVDLIIPLSMKLCWETGLNTGSLLSLKRDCFQESHPLTGQPYLYYYKERSTGEKHLHLNLFDPTERTQMPLLSKQSVIIKHTIELILKLTEPLVCRADESDRDFLFIYQTKKFARDKPNGRVIRLKASNIARWTKPLLKKLKDEGNEHVPVYLNLARFRPSRITQLVRDGKDFFDIQAIAGHARVHSTLEYLSNHQIAPQARREVSAVLQQIHENKEEFEANPKEYATVETQRGQNVIYKAVMCDCKNVYDPPQSVRRLKTYKAGQSCTYFNMCLTCPNVIITKKHLPLLLRYKQEIEQSIQENNLTNIPSIAHYEQALAVFYGILLEFDRADIAWAQEIAECSDTYIDPVTYRGIDEY